MLRQNSERDNGNASFKRMWIMKLTKTLIAAVALSAFATPMTATAQVGPNSVIGGLQNVTGPVYIKRGGTVLRAIEDSAVLPFDQIVAEAGGSAMVSLNGCNGNFQPCSNLVADGNMIMLDSTNYCSDLAALRPMGAGDAILSAGSSVPTTGGYTGPSIGTAMSQKTLLAILGTAVIGGGLYAILDDNDDDDDDLPASP